MGEQLAQGHVHGQGLTQAGDELHGQQGVAAEFEEMVVPADPFHAEQVLPDLGDGLFGRPLWCLVGLGGQGGVVGCG
ncbi:hypothetical protein NB709_004121 [Xanthomonas sacchari]|nr:hypothetical protein [Xanthomonas sacchari]